MKQAKGLPDSWRLTRAMLPELKNAMLSSAGRAPQAPMPLSALLS